MSAINVNNVDIVFYHGGCSDGIAAAYPFWQENKTRFQETFDNLDTKHLSEESYQESISKGSDPFLILPLYDRNQLSPYLVRNKRVILVDICFEKETLLELCQTAEEVLILDHHETTLRTLENLEIENLYPEIDQTRSAAQIAWDWAYKSEERPWFIDYIADRDLWKFDLPDSKIINKAMYHGDMICWEKMEWIRSLSHEDNQRLLEKLRIEGSIIDRIDQKTINYSCRSARSCIFDGYKVKLVTVNFHLRSEIGNRLVKDEDCDFAACANYNYTEDLWQVALRASDKSEINLSKLCEKYGGGGLPKASSLRIYGPHSEKWKMLKDGDEKSLYGTLRDFFYPVE